MHYYKKLKRRINNFKKVLEEKDEKIFNLEKRFEELNQKLIEVQVQIELGTLKHNKEINESRTQFEIGRVFQTQTNGDFDKEVQSFEHKEKENCVENQIFVIQESPEYVCEITPSSNNLETTNNIKQSRPKSKKTKGSKKLDQMFGENKEVGAELRAAETVVKAQEKNEIIELSFPSAPSTVVPEKFMNLLEESEKNLDNQVVRELTENRKEENVTEISLLPEWRTARDKIPDQFKCPENPNKNKENQAKDLMTLEVEEDKKNHSKKLSSRQQPSNPLKDIRNLDLVSKCHPKEKEIKMSAQQKAEIQDLRKVLKLNENTAKHLKRVQNEIITRKDFRLKDTRMPLYVNPEVHSPGLSIPQDSRLEDSGSIKFLNESKSAEKSEEKQVIDQKVLQESDGIGKVSQKELISTKVQVQPLEVIKVSEKSDSNPIAKGKDMQEKKEVRGTQVPVQTIVSQMKDSKQLTENSVHQSQRVIMKEDALNLASNREKLQEKNDIRAMPIRVQQSPVNEMKVLNKGNENSNSQAEKVLKHKKKSKISNEKELEENCEADKMMISEDTSSRRMIDSTRYEYSTSYDQGYSLHTIKRNEEKKEESVLLKSSESFLDLMDVSEWEQKPEKIKVKKPQSSRKKDHSTVQLKNSKDSNLQGLEKQPKIYGKFMKSVTLNEVLSRKDNSGKFKRKPATPEKTKKDENNTGSPEKCIENLEDQAGSNPKFDPDDQNLDLEKTREMNEKMRSDMVALIHKYKALRYPMKELEADLEAMSLKKQRLVEKIESIEGAKLSDLNYLLDTKFSIKTSLTAITEAANDLLSKKPYLRDKIDELNFDEVFDKMRDEEDKVRIEREELKMKASNLEKTITDIIELDEKQIESETYKLFNQMKQIILYPKKHQ